MSIGVAQREGSTSTSQAAAIRPRADLLRAYLEAYWLRPENALWMSLRSAALTTVPPRGSAIDVGCGDGIFSFLHLGGRFDPSFDVFTACGNLSRVRNQHADMFDVAADDYAPAITAHPQRTLDAGLDLKLNLLNKAATLGVYNALVQHDGNRALPIADDSFDWVYCNASYWIADVEPFLAELGRICRPGGKIVLQVKLESIRDCTLAPLSNMLGEKFLDIIGRGRFDCWPSLADRREWESRFARAGLEIGDATPIVSSDHARLWDVGLRPIAPMLVRMAQRIDEETRYSVKRDWIELFMDLLTPLATSDLNLTNQAVAPPEIQYVLTT